MAGPSTNGTKTKRCYACGTHLPVSVDRCTSCKRRVGPPDENGLAKQPFNWRGYTLAICAWAAFGYYLWWAFLRSTE